ADKNRFSRYRQVVDVVVNISWATGIVMLLFALLIFTLFIQLTIASCKEEIILLVTLGASPKQLRRFLMRQFFPVNILIIVLALLIISGLQFFAYSKLIDQSIFINRFLSSTTVLIACIVLVIIWWVNSFSIRKYISEPS